MLPSFFIAHGSPLLAIEDNAYTQFLSGLGKAIARPKAIVIFSAHWESDIQILTNVEEYSTIHDFGGFPEELYRIVYPAKGDKQLDQEVESLLDKQGIHFQVDTKRGLDHGSWVILRLLYPEADIPVVSMSVNPHSTPEEQYKIGKALSQLRSKDVLIICSGGTVHNLRALNWEKEDDEVDDWALNFDEWLAGCLRNWDLTALFKYHSLGPSAKLAVPPYGVEHFIPLFYAMGAADDARTASLLQRSYKYGNLSHSVWQFG